MFRQSRKSVRSAKGSSNRRRVTPRVEALEDRLAPAVHTWTHGSPNSNNWTNDGNWDAAGRPTTGEAGGTIVVIPINDTACVQNIGGLVIAQLQFTNSVDATVTLTTPLGIDGSAVLNNIVNSSGSNTITGSSLTLSGADCWIDVANRLTIESQITGNQGIRKLSTGTLTLSTALASGNTYTGTTTIKGGQPGVEHEYR